jgi:hypothetical protein
MQAMPDTGTVNKRRFLGANTYAEEPEWFVTLSYFELSTEQARRVGAQLLNLSDMVDRLNSGEVPS